MNVETVVKLNRFQCRTYQAPIFDAIENKGYKKVLAILPRRAGKDVAAFNLMIRSALRKVGVYYYILPTYSQARKVIWDSITNDGQRFLDYIPSELIARLNGTEMKITLINGSIIQLCGSTDYDRLMGTNPQGIVFSEYALQDPRAYHYLRPILTTNQGWAVFISTVRGKNHLFELYQIASYSPDWFAYKMTVEETNHIPLAEIERERREGIMSEDLIQQEYYNSFDLGVEGAYYGKYLDKIRLNGQITQVPHEPGFKVHTAWDLGVRDSTAIIFFQVIGQTVRIIDYYENSKVGLEHYAKVLQEKDYIYGKHIAPHDIKVREFGTGMTRLEQARNMGISFTVAPNLTISDGIEAGRILFSKLWVDENKCATLLKALENYRQEYDSKKKVYKNHPLHDQWSHACFTGDTKILTRSGMRQIMDVIDGDEVLTLFGWKSCTKAQKTQKNASLVQITFADGTKVKCTEDHLFLTTKGWKSAQQLTRGSAIQSGLMNALNILMEESIVYGKMRDILLRLTNGASIKRYGKKLLAQSQKIVTYTTETLMPLTTNYGTLSVFQQKSIFQFQDQIIRDSRNVLASMQLHGIGQLPEENGTVNIVVDLPPGLNGDELQKSACAVNLSLKALYAEANVIKSFVTQTVKPLIIGKVEKLKKKEDVWDIGVPDAGHFSLSNGAIVHNCDAFRYLAISINKTREGATPEDIEKRYQEAYYGKDSNMPAIFRENSWDTSR